MNRRTKRGLVIGGAALAIVGGGGGALAATGGGGIFGSDGQKALLDDAAGRLKVDSADLKTALQQAYDDQIDAAVKAGRITAAQGTELKARAKANGGFPFLGGPGGPGFGHRGGPFGGPGETMAAAATYLGLTEAQLDTQLDSGKTLAQIAKAQSKTVAGLKAAMLAAAKTQLDAAVKAGKLTQAQADSMLADISTRLDDEIQNGRPHRGGPGFEGRPHFDGRGFGSRSFAPPSGDPAA